MPDLPPLWGLTLIGALTVSDSIQQKNCPHALAINQFLLHVHLRTFDTEMHYLQDFLDFEEI
jgi:hypothetical protein